MPLEEILQAAFKLAKCKKILVKKVLIHALALGLDDC